MPSLRDQIVEILEAPNLASAGYRADQIVRILWAPGADPLSGIEQGISRIALLGFVMNEDGPWNGERRFNGHRSAWVRYRGHQIVREQTPDGLLIAVAYTDHTGAAREARLRPSQSLTDVEAALLIAENIDDLLDAVIEEHGLPSAEPVVEAEVLEHVDGKTATRVLDAYGRWLVQRPNTGGSMADVGGFAAAIDRGEVEP